MRLDKNIASKVHIHHKGVYLSSFYDGFPNVDSIRRKVLQFYQNKGIVDVSISQDGGYHKSIKVNTNKK